MSNLCPAPPVPSSHQGPTKESSQTRWSLCFLTAVKHDAGSVLFIQPQINNSKVDPTVAGESPHTADCNQTWSVCYCHWRSHIFGICHAHFKAQMTLCRLQIIRLFVGPLVLLGPGCPGFTSVYLQASGGVAAASTPSLSHICDTLSLTRTIRRLLIYVFLIFVSRMSYLCFGFRSVTGAAVGDTFYLLVSASRQTGFFFVFPLIWFSDQPTLLTGFLLLAGLRTAGWLSQLDLQHSRWVSVTNRQVNS